MAKRTRNHILEDNSRKFLNNILPENWVYRDKDKDYGIDCEVEIFDTKGNTTGLVFWVQLKATDSNKPAIIKNITFSIDKIQQFQSYNVPVMIVRFSQSDEILYYSWANDLATQTRNDEKVKVHFSNEQLFNTLSFDEIYFYLKNHHYVKYGNYSFPINTYISKNTVNSDNVTINTKQFFRKIIQNKPQYFCLVRNNKDSILQVKIGKAKTYLTLTDNQFSSIGYELVNLTEESEEYFTNIFLACYTILLFNANKKEIAEKIFFENQLIHVLKLRREFLVYFLPHLIMSDNYKEVLSELEEMFDITEDNTIQNISLILLMISKSLSTERQTICEKFLIKQIEYSRNKKYTLGIAISNYNLGNFYRSIGDNLKSIKHYLNAKKYNIDYKSKGYFYYDIAGVLFELKKYYFASVFFKKSINLNTEHYLAKALLADSLLYLGKYEIAVNYLDDFLTEQSDNKIINKDEWYLKFMCFNSLLLNEYPKTQKREPELAVQKVNGRAKINIEKALDYDLLCYQAWVKNGQKANKEHNYIETFISYIMAALFCKENILLWVYATVSGFLEQGEIYYHSNYVIRLAYKYHEEDYVDLLHEYIEKNIPEILDPIMHIVEICIKDIQKEEYLIRIIEDEKNYQLLKM